jgi:hypothetical protein
MSRDRLNDSMSFQPSRSYRSINLSAPKYKQLSPRISFSKPAEPSSIIILKDCDDNKDITPNMELRKDLFKLSKTTSQKDNIYSRNLRWYQKKIEKLNEKRWDLQVSELSCCTFTPSVNKKKKNNL